MIQSTPDGREFLPQNCIDSDKFRAGDQPSGEHPTRNGKRRVVVQLTLKLLASQQSLFLTDTAPSALPRMEAMLPEMLFFAPP